MLEDPTAAHPTEAVAATGSAVKLALVAALGGLLFGFDSSVVNGTTSSIRQTFDPGSLLLGAAVAAVLIGAAIGAWFAGGIADRLGRPRTMVLTGVLFAIGAVGCAFAFSIWDLMIWRLLCGVAIGGASVIVPAYTAEISPAAIRGRMGSLWQLAIVSGIFIALLSDFLLAHLAGGASEQLALGLEAWRWMFLVGVVPAVIYGLLALRLPESPRSLVAQGRHDDAEEQVRRYVGGDIAGHLQQIERSVDLDHHSTLADLRGPRFGLLPIVWVGIGVSVFQQFVGINVIFYYSTELWQSVGFTESNALLIGVITAVTNIVTTILGILLIDRIGRRRLLLAGSVGMAVGLATMAILFAGVTTIDGQPRLGDPQGTIALIAANVFVFSFGFSWGPVAWVLLGEMFPSTIRTKAIAVGATAQWLANFVVSQSFPALKDLGLELAYGTYAVFALLSILFVWRLVPETKGRELEDMTTG